MWCYINKSDVEEFLNTYPSVIPIFNELCLYETDDKILLPRYLYRAFESDKLNVFKSKSFAPAQTSLNFTKKLRLNQQKIINHVLSLYKRDGFVSGIIKAPPGTGKTVMGVYLSCALKLKTIVVVDNTNLLKQWIDAYINFSDISKADLGIIGQSIFNIEDKPVIICLVQTLVSKIKNHKFKDIFSKIDKERIGLVIYDEVHVTSSAPKYAKASIYFRAENMLGLSATPFQTGTAKILMENTVGRIIYESKTYEMTPTYVLNYYDSNLASTKYGRLIHRPNLDYIKRKSVYNNIIIRSSNFFQVVSDLTAKRLEEGHTVMILCFTKNQVNMIYDYLKSRGIESSKYYGDEHEEIDENTRVLVGTYAFIGKGFDFDKLSSLILATNLAGRKSLIQAIGRILRYRPNKPKPVVDDLIDISFPSIFVPDIKMKKSIVSKEFDCDILENKIFTNQEVTEEELQ